MMGGTTLLQKGIPEWADARLSAELPVLRARGESQEQEFIVEFPKQARELGREVAAFATSNAGLILLGVADNGDLVGIPGLEEMTARDALLRRLEGVCSGIVKPAITPSVAFAIEESKVVVAVRVPHGREPVYYCNSVPYVRHLTAARPAEPHEVVELVTSWSASATRVVGSLPRPVRDDSEQLSEEDQRLGDFVSELAAVLRDLLVYGSQADKRKVNPQLDELMATFGYAGTDLRRLAAREEAERLEVRSQLNDLAEKCEAVAHHTHVLGAEAWRRYLSLVESATDGAAELKKVAIDPVPFSAESQAGALQVLEETVRLLQDLSSRADKMAFGGRLDELQSEIALHGQRLVELAYLGLDRLPARLPERLRHIGAQLHLVEMTRHTFGRTGIQRICETLAEAVSELDELLPAIRETVMVDATLGN